MMRMPAESCAMVSPPARARTGALVLLAACATCVGFAGIASRLSTSPVEEQALALGGAPDQSRRTVVGDANIDAAWRGAWKRRPASYDAVSRELAGFQALGRTDTRSPAPEAIERGESILDGYSKVLGTKRTVAKPHQTIEQKKRLYDTFILQGGKKAQLYDAATHDQELNKYSSVLSFNDRLSAQAINGPTGKAIKSSKDELDRYSSILDFTTPVPDLKRTNAVNSHKDILAFPGNSRDQARIEKREANHHVLQADAVAAVHDSHKGILTFAADEQGALAASAPRQEAEHKVKSSSASAVNRGSEDTTRKVHGHVKGRAAARESAARESETHTLQPQLISRELSSYDDILEFPGQRQLSRLKDAPSSSKELKGYDGILDFGGHASSARTGEKAASSRTGEKASSPGKGAVARGAGSSVTGTSNKKAAPAKGGASGEVGGASTKRGSPTMLLDEQLVHQTVEEEKAMEEKAILIEPPAAAASSPIAKKLASLYEEAKRLISEETRPAKKQTDVAAVVSPQKRAAIEGRTKTDRGAPSSKAARERKRVVGQGDGAQGVLRARRRLSRDPVLRRLQRQAAELRKRLRLARVQKQRDDVEREAVTDVLSHKEKLLKLDESLEGKLTHTSRRVVKRADKSMAQMMRDDEERLQELEAAQARRAAVRARKRALQADEKHLTKAERQHLELQREHALLLAKIHQLRKNLPSSYENGFVSGAGNIAVASRGAARKGVVLEVVGPDSSQQLAQLDHAADASRKLSPDAKSAYAHKLAQVEAILGQARALANGILQKERIAGRAESDVADVDKDLEGIAKILKDRAMQVVLTGQSGDEELHRQQLRQLVDEAVVRADMVLSTGAAGARGLEREMQELRVSVEDRPGSGFASSRGKEQELRTLLAQEHSRKGRLRRAMSALHKHLRAGPRAPRSLLKKTEAALERSGDYVVALHPRPTLLGKKGKDPVRGSDGAQQHAEEVGEPEWQRELKSVQNPDLLSERSDSTQVLSREGELDEDKALKSDVSALVDATRTGDVKQYDAMLKAAIKKSEKKLAGFEAAQGSEAHAVAGELASADKVFAARRARKPASAVRDAMASAQRIEKQLHIKFDKKGSIYELSSRPAAVAARHGKHYIPGLGNIHKDNGLISALFKHHRMPVAQVEALEQPRMHKLSKRTHARLTNHGVFKPKGVRRRFSAKEPNAWHIVDKDADAALADGSSVGKDVAEVTGWALKGLTTDADTRQANGVTDPDIKANSLWHYV